MAMSVTYATFCGQIVAENRGGAQGFYVADNLGSTKALINSAGTVTDTWTYWPYGEVQNRNGTTATPFTFCGVLGYLQDLLNDLTYVRARFLRVALARWQTVDTWWPAEEPYAYALSSPVIYDDPFGTMVPTRNACIDELDRCMGAADRWRNACWKDIQDVFDARREMCRQIKDRRKKLDCIRRASVGVQRGFNDCSDQAKEMMDDCMETFKACQEGQDRAAEFVAIGALGVVLVACGGEAFGGLLPAPMPIPLPLG